MAMHAYFPLKEMKLLRTSPPSKNLCVDKIASRAGGILSVDKIVHFTIFSIMY